MKNSVTPTINSGWQKQDNSELLYTDQTKRIRTLEQENCDLIEQNNLLSKKISVLTEQTQDLSKQYDIIVAEKQALVKKIEELEAKILELSRRLGLNS